MRTYSSGLKISSGVTLAFFLWSFGPLFQVAAFAADKKQSSGARVQGAERQASEPRVQGSGERFEKAIEDIREKVGRAGERSHKGEEPVAEIQFIKAKKAEIEALDAELKSEFAATEKKLKDAKLPHEILSRHANFVEHYQSNLRQLIANLEGIDRAQTKAEVDATVKKTKDHLEKVKPPRRHKQLDPNKLPHRTEKAKEKAPRLKKEEFERDFPQKKHKNLAADDKAAHSSWLIANQQLRATNQEPFHTALANKPILVASNGSLSGLLSSNSEFKTQDWSSSVPSVNSEPALERLNRGVNEVNPYSASTLQHFDSSTPLLLAQAAQDIPTAEDFAETPEVQFTPEIQTLANSLGKNSLRLYEFVRNNFKYEPYYGSLKGAQQTLREKAGNDFDLASLLISLYRSAGIPAHYVIATISMPLSQAQRWLGLDDPRMVGRLLASAGVPVAVDYTAGVIRLEHVLVQAWVPYQNGRGALNGPGDTWVYMDPSFKEIKVTQILNQSIPAFDQTQYLGQLRPEDPSEYYSALIQENLNTSAPGRTVYAVARHRELVPISFEILLGMPQYDIISTGGSFQGIPDHFRYKVAFELTNPDTLETSLSYQTSTAELAGKRITLSYSPATTNDQTIISNYGDIYNTPAYLIKLKPELKLEGTTVAEGLPIGSGVTHPFNMRFISATGASEYMTNNAVAGAYYAVALDLQTVTPRMVYERTKKLQMMNDLINSGGSVSLDDHAGELLYATALTYFQKLDAANRKAQELLKINDLRGVSEAIFSIDVQVASIFGIPRSVDISGIHIDVDRDMHLPIPVDGNLTRIKEFNLLIGSNSSFFEHKIIEDIYPSGAISAVKGLQLANTQAIQVYTINKDNINSIMPTLQIRSEIKADIVNAVNAGREVIAPQREIQVEDWTGLGYIAMDPATGEAAYMISGGLAGGDSIGISLFTWIKAMALTSNVAMAKETAAIESIVVRDYTIFFGEDGIYGTEDDVRVPYARDDFSFSAMGPANTKCAGKISEMFYNPDPDFGGPLLDLGNAPMDKKISKNLTLGDMVVNGGTTSYARISLGLATALEHYMQSLKDEAITPKTNSVYRTWYHNCELTLQGAVINSNHMAGIAADVGVSSRQGDAAQIALTLFGNIGGVGYKKYSSFVHVDIGRPRTW